MNTYIKVLEVLGAIVAGLTFIASLIIISQALGLTVVATIAIAGAGALVLLGLAMPFIIEDYKAKRQGAKKK